MKKTIEQRNIVTTDDILRSDGKVFFIGNNQLPQQDTETIFNQAHTLDSLYLWKLLIRDLRWQGYEKMRVAGSNEKDEYYQGWAMENVAYQLEVKVKKLISQKEIIKSQKKVVVKSKVMV